MEFEIKPNAAIAYFLIKSWTIYSQKYTSYSLVLLNVFIVSYGIAKCIREIVSNKAEV